MMNVVPALNEKRWRGFPVDFLFEINGEVNDCETVNGDDVSFVTASAVHNGVTKCVSLDDADGRPIDRQFISVAKTGTPFKAFYQKGVSVVDANAARLHLRNKLYRDNPFVQQFLVTLFEKQRSKFTYGYVSGIKRMSRTMLLLPVDDANEPDYAYMAEYVQQKRDTMLAKYRAYVEERIAELGEVAEIPALDEKEWHEFDFAEIFDIKKGFYNKKPEDSGNGTIPFLGATDSNNGVTRFLTLDEIANSTKTGVSPNSPLDKKLFPGHAIAVTNNGSVGHAYYQATPFTCSHDINPLYLRDHEMSRDEANFLIKAIEEQGKLFQYARKWRPIRMVKSKLLLPVTDSGEPDYEYMEQYAKNMMLRKYQQYLAFLGVDETAGQGDVPSGQTIK